MNPDPGPTSQTRIPCYLLPWKCCTGYLKRWGYKPLAKKYFKELTLGAIPIIFAASFSTFMITLIEYIAEDNEEEKDGLIAGQTFIYAALTYLLGLFLSIRLKLDLQSKNPTQITEWLEKQKFTEVVFGIFAESSAFALKEFLAMVFAHSLVGSSI